MWCRACRHFSPGIRTCPWTCRPRSEPSIWSRRASTFAHMGLVQAPAWLFAPEIASGAVVSLLPDFAPAPMPIHAVHPAGRRLPTKTRVFIDFVSEILTSDPGPAFVPVRTWRVFRRHRIMPNRDRGPALPRRSQSPVDKALDPPDNAWRNTVERAAIQASFSNAAWVPGGRPRFF
ncbi:LysR substrate-binding domain-containing protein [Paraburkholderia sp. MM5496-R1]|uniref:LysR substrate-binding domain-containing protein n=2 Tax=unclassified Paraburkholderia TaxID=2615204 RepID=UPI003D239726